MASQSLSTIATVPISALSIARMIIGSSMLLAPQLSASFFGVPLTPESNIAGRLFGARDLILGVLLWKSRSNLTKSILKADGVLMEDARRDIKRLLWIGLLIDSIDVGSSLFGIWRGEMDGKAFGWVGGGAAGGVILAGICLRAL
jgi:hypothetical protein